MISFAIITDGKEPAKLEAQIKSIHALSIPGYEIAVAGNPPVGIAADYIIPMPHTARQGRLGALRNGAVSVASGDILVVTDDDMMFLPGWYGGLVAYAGDWDVMACRILNPDGSRYWDWKAHSGGKNWLLDYNETSELVSLTGGLTICKSYVWEQCKWDDELGFNQAEDVDFSNRVKAAGYKIVFNPLCTITHDAPYTQLGVGVFKKE
jgi:hypothetical protein